MSLIGLLASVALAVALPLLAAGRFLRLGRRCPERAFLLSGPLALASVPFLAMGLALLLGTVLSAGLIVCSALAASALLWALGRPAAWRPPSAALAALALLSLAFGLLLDVEPPRDSGLLPFGPSVWMTPTNVAVYDTVGAGTVTWLQCSHVTGSGFYRFLYPRSAAASDGVPLSALPCRASVPGAGAAVVGGGPPRREDAVHLFPARRALPDDYVTNGYVNTMERRPGAAAVLGSLVALLGLGGFRAAFAVALAGMLLSALAASRSLSGAGWAGPLAVGLAVYTTVLTSFGDEPWFCYVFDYVKADALLASLLSAALLALALGRPSPREWLAAGLLAGALLGVRDMAVLCLPALSVPLLRDRRPRRASALLAVGALASLLPTLYVARYSLGSMWSSPGLAMFLGEGLPYSILGVDVRLPILLNAPFRHNVVRAPTNAFPMLLFFPLMVLLLLGTALSSLALLGVARTLSRDRPRGLLLALWALPLFAALMVQEDVYTNKSDLLHLALPAIWVAVPEGARAAGSGRGLAALCALALLLSLGARAAGRIEFQVDERWTALYGAPDVDRFALEFQREALSAGSPLPIRPWAPPLSAARLARDLGGALDPRPLGERPCLLPRFDLDTDDVVVELEGQELPARARFALSASSGAGSPVVRRLRDGFLVSFGRPGGLEGCTLLDVEAVDDGSLLALSVRPFGPAECGMECPEPSAHEGASGFLVRTDMPRGLAVRWERREGAGPG